MAINKYNDLSAIFSNHNTNNNNNNNNDIIFGSTSCNMLDVVNTSSYEIGTSCCSYYGLDDHMSAIHDLSPGPNEYSSLFDVVNQSSGPVMGRKVVDPSPASSVLRCDSSSEVVNSVPTTPNSISISSSSSEGPRQEDGEDQDKDGDDNKSKKQLKAKKMKEKKKKEPRFAFMTKTDVDHLDDGYRWRKYGQKAVKNSPFPRSYYRCTTAACGVKKRVERSSVDPSIVVTTYEGQHTHPCPIMTRGGFGFGFGIGAGIGTGSFPSQPLDQCSTAPVLFGGSNAATSSTSHFFPYFHNKYHQQQFPGNYTQFSNPNCSPSLRTFTFNDGGSRDGSSSSIISSLATTISSDGDDGGGLNNLQQSNPTIDSLQPRHIQPPCSTSNSHHQLRDDGLLQDIVPSQMRNEAIKDD